MKILTNKKYDSTLKSTIKSGIKDFIKNITTSNKKGDALSKIIAEQLDRVAKDIESWKNNVNSAEDIINPDRQELIEQYRDFVDDYQLWSAMQIRTNKAISGNFKILDEKGEVDEQETRKFLDPHDYPLPWFRDFMRIIQDAKYYGYEAVQLGDVVDNIFVNVEKIPEENLIPYYHSMLINANTSFIPGGDGSIDLTQDPYATWVVRTGSETDLGLINKCAPYIIYKNVFGSWAQHADVFGMPIRIGRTDLHDPDRKQNMMNMLDESEGATWGVFDEKDMIEFIEQKGGNDPHNIYGMLIEKCDQAISKIILSQTGTTDEKSFAGSADVHMSIFEDIIFSDKLDISNVINQTLIPNMKKIGMIDSGKKVFGAWDFSEKITISQWTDIIQKLSQSGYFIPPEEVKKKTTLELEENIIATPENRTFSVMNKVDQMYNKFLKNG